MAAGSLLPTLRPQFKDGNGRPLANGWVQTYVAGTTTPRAVFTDAALLVPHANPAPLDPAGRATVFLDPALSYKFVLLDATRAHVWTQDCVSAVSELLALTSDFVGAPGAFLLDRHAAYLYGGDGRWWPTDADVEDRSSLAPQVAVSMGIDAQGASLRMLGLVDGYTGRVAGQVQYVSSTDGSLTPTRPLNRRVVGVAVSATTVLVGPEPRDEDRDVFPFPVEFGGHHVGSTRPLINSGTGAPNVFSGVTELAFGSAIRAFRPSQVPSGTIRFEVMLACASPTLVDVGLFDLTANQLVQYLGQYASPSYNLQRTSIPITFNHADTTVREYGFRVVAMSSGVPITVHSLRLVRTP